MLYIGMIYSNGDIIFSWIASAVILHDKYNDNDK